MARYDRIISSTVLTPPGSPTDGDTYIIGGTGTGAWSGHDQEIAVAAAGAAPSAGDWIFNTPTDGQHALSVAGRGGKTEIMVYSQYEDEWFPLLDRWTTTEYWTGRYFRGGEKIMSITVDLADWPNTTVKNWAHGASGTLDFTVPIKMEGSVWVAASSIQYPLEGGRIQSSGNTWDIRVQGANVRVQSGWDMSSYDGECRLEYALA